MVEQFITPPEDGETEEEYAARILKAFEAAGPGGAVHFCTGTFGPRPGEYRVNEN